MGNIFERNKSRTRLGKAASGSYDPELYDPESGPIVTETGKWDVLGKEGRADLERTQSFMSKQGWGFWVGPECLLDGDAKPTFPMIHTVRDKERANAKTQGRDDV